ncbi:division/cell wall cluster transcriptional repressor MraZ [[Mycoplasma] gypis]|uniref:Transcriptional regulator MraZ n=1 Tax=[Mycoplasma] gypis TaxID=92404 RepID=A0ABZ2RTS0_9BACT|nr:division/cell wall cluster transcriptional repressor MraZ [[Mycoplasma] gypis]MBN0919197.1 division/cell wall cluster transcriptional repressor MraZ [[Mycoplasma] gypis]
MYGKYDRTIDEKNRLVIPSKFRNELGNTFFITYGLDSSITVRNQEQFDLLTKKISENNLLDKNVRQFSRYIFANTEEVSVDKSGRITLPQRFIDKAAIKKDVVFIGLGNISEIFAKEVYEQTEAMINEEENFDQLAQSLFESGIKL